MQKQLNPDLFDESGVFKTRMVDSDPNSGMSFQQVVQFDQKLAEMRTQMNSVVEQMNLMISKVNEFMRTSRDKFETLQGAITQLEQNDQTLNLVNGEKLAQLGQKIGERRALDLKTQEMIDRHNSVLKTYELRLSMLQKLIGEREEQIVSMQGMLNESKMELSRLKRF